MESSEPWMPIRNKISQHTHKRRAWAKQRKGTLRSTCNYDTIKGLFALTGDKLRKEIEGSTYIQADFCPHIFIAYVNHSLRLLIRYVSPLGPYFIGWNFDSKMEWGNQEEGRKKTFLCIFRSFHSRSPPKMVETAEKAEKKEREERRRHLADKSGRVGKSG